MDIELQKELVSLSSKIGDTSIETVVEADIIVPDTKPDIGKILQVDAIAKVTGSEVQNERMLVYGDVTYQILYMPDSEESGLRNITAQSTFTDIAEMKGIAPEMRGSVGCDVTSVEFKVLNGRKLAVKSIVGIDATVYQDTQTEVVTGVASDDLEILQKEIAFLKVHKICDKGFSVSDKLIIPTGSPSAREILKIDGKIADKAVKVINNKVIVKGDLSLITLYTDEGDESIRTMNNVIPFTEILEIDGINSDWTSYTNLDIAGIHWSHETDEDGEGRIINVDVSVASKVVFAQNVELNTVCDCYSLSGNADATLKRAVLEKKIGDFSNQVSLKDKIYIGDDCPRIGQIYNVVSKAYVDELNIEDNRVIVKGVADTYLLYLADDPSTPIYSVKKELPFTEIIECAGVTPGMECDLDAQVTSVSYTLDDHNSAEIRCNVSLDGFVTAKVSETVITDISVSEKDESQEKPSSITVYFVQDQDSLWDIAKKYATTMDSILEVNGIAAGAPLAGRQLIIPKYKQ